jgi:hypothetical protein
MMRTTLALAFAGLLAFVVAVPAVVVNAQDKDKEPGVTVTQPGGICGLGPYGSTTIWYWAVYSNGRGVLKCDGELPPDQTPPTEKIQVPLNGSCGTPGGPTTDAFFTIDVDGRIALVCRTRP